MRLETIAIIFALATLPGCTSDNARIFNPDTVTKCQFNKQTIKNIFLEPVSMSNPDDDMNCFTCRMESIIYLPYRKPASGYIEEAFKKSLQSMNKLSAVRDTAHSMRISLTQIALDSYSGSWKVEGEIIIDSQPSIKVTSETAFKTSSLVASTCRNASAAFDKAVADFVVTVLSDQSVVRQLQ